MIKGNRKGRNNDGSQTLCKHSTFLHINLQFNLKFRNEFLGELTQPSHLNHLKECHIITESTYCCEVAQHCLAKTTFDPLLCSTSELTIN